MVVIEQSGCILARLLYSGKGGCNRPKVVVLVQSGSIQAKEFVFGQSDFIRAKLLYSGKSVCIEGR